MSRPLFKSEQYSCIVCGADKENVVTLFSFPNKFERRCKWMDILGISTIKSRTRVCEKHFEKNQFHRTKLKKDAIPSNNIQARISCRQPFKDPTFINIQPKQGLLLKKPMTPLPTSESSYVTVVDPCKSNDSYCSTAVNHRPPSIKCATSNFVLPYVTNMDTWINNRSTEITNRITAVTPKCQGLQNDPQQTVTTPLTAHEINLKTLNEKLRTKIYKLKEMLKISREREKKSVNLEKVLKINPTFQQFVQGQISRYKKKQQKYTKFEKSVALSIYYACGGNGYRQLKGMGVILPCKKTLHNWTKEFNFPPGLCDELLLTIQHITSDMTAADKDCVLVWDEMHIKEFLQYNSYTDKLEGIVDLGHLIGRRLETANEVLVFMVQGIRQKWKFPLSYHFSSHNTKSEDLAKLVQQHIMKLQEVGLNVRMCICDMAFTNRSLYKEWNITEDQPYCNSEQRKIYFIHDTPHLIKLVRNNLMKYDFVIKKRIGNKWEEKKIRWLHILNFFNKDRRLTTRMAPKLTTMHVFLKDYSKMKVKLATQLLSHSVYAGMSSMISSKILKVDARPTALFVKNIDDLFDLVNISKLNEDKPSRNAENLFKDFTRFDIHLNFLKEIEIPKYPHSPEFLHGLKLSLLGIKMLCSDLKTEGYEYVFTRRLQQDCLENLFATVRIRGGNCQNPTASQFRHSFKCIFLARLLKNPQSSNTESCMDNSIFIDCIDRLKSNEENVNASISSDMSNETNYVSKKIPYFYGRKSSRVLKLGKEQQNEVISYFGPVCVLSVNRKNACIRCAQMVNYRDNNVGFVNYKQMEASSSLATLNDETKSIFVYLNTKFDEFTQATLKEDGSEVASGILKRFISTDLISKWTQGSCKSHKMDMISYFIRVKLYRIVRGKNENVKKSKSWDQTRRDLRNQ